MCALPDARMSEETISSILFHMCILTATINSSTMPSDGTFTCVYETHAHAQAQAQAQAQPQAQAQAQPQAHGP